MDMNEYKYRDDARRAISDANWTFWRAAPWLFVAIVVLTLFGFGLRSAGVLGSTVVEREVFEASYQRQAALKQQIATDEAVLAEIRVKLSNPDLNANTKVNLMAQASAANVRIAAAKRGLAE